MFSKIAIFATITLALSVAAAPVAGDGGDDDCIADEIYCCNQVEQSQSAAGANIARTIVGLDVQSLTGLIGANCSPVTVIGAANGGTCTTQPVRCEDDYNNGAVVTYCNPITAVV